MDIAEVTDPTTAQMCAESGHQCIMCPSDVRNLYAVAQNAHNAVTAALGAHGSWERAHRKLAELGRALEVAKAQTGTHFEALDAWRRP